MTLFIADVASYQGSLAAADFKRAEFAVANLKISHGLGRKSVHPNVTGWVDDCRRLGLGISTFHYLTADAPGEAQAEYAYDRMTELGLARGTVHQLDVESDPPPLLSSVRGYLTRMAALLGRPVVLYTGDWWWEPRGWNVSDLTPYLWAAPGVGYLGAYPGDESAHWRAGYGGWPVLSVMQYAVAPLHYPDGTIGTIKVSKSAVRDLAAWRALTGEADMAWVLVPCLVALRNEFNKIAPNRDKSSDGAVGDPAHAASASDHNPDETGNAPIRDADSTDEVHAIDVDIDLRQPGLTMEQCVQAILARCRSGKEKRLWYIIFNRRIWVSDSGWAQQAYTGSNPHDKHAHFSASYDTARESDTRPWGLEGLVDDVSADDVLTALESARGKAAIYAALTGMDKVPSYNYNGVAIPPKADDPTHHTVTGATVLQRMNRLATWLYPERFAALVELVTRNTATLDKVLANVINDDGDRAAIEQQIADARTAIVAVPQQVAELLGSDDMDLESKAAALRAVLGDDAAAVGRLLTEQE